jgi:hypothetical protein
MKSTLVQSGDFTYTAELRPLARPVDHYSLTITSTWGDAKDPTAQRTVVQITADTTGLVELRDLIDRTVSAVDELGVNGGQHGQT